MESTQKVLSLFFLIIYLPQVILLKADLDQIKSMLKGNLFQGRWSSSDPSIQQFNYLTLDSGEIQAEFYGSLVQFIFYNPQYQENKHVIAQFELTNYAESTQTWTQTVSSFLQGGNNLQQTWIESSCTGTFLFKINSNTDDIDIDQLSIDANLQSSDIKGYHCNFDLNFKIHKVKDYSYINNLFFCIIATIILVAQLLSTNKLIKQIKEQQIQILQLSVTAASLTTIQGLNLFYFLINALFQNFDYAYFYILPTFIQLTQCIFKDSTVVGLLWSHRQMLAQLERRELVKQIVLFILVSNFIIITNLVLFQLYGNSFCFMLIQAFVIYPQIIHNIRIGIKEKFNFHYILGFLSSKLFFYLYVRSCPANVKSMRTDYLFVGVFLGVYFFSLLLIILQWKYGSRCFIPKIFLPKQFRYLQKVTVHDQMECPICLNPLYLNPNDQIDETNNQNKQSFLCQIMITPCKHEFHPSCLEEWIQIQNKCPTCRRDLPPLNEIGP